MDYKPPYFIEKKSILAGTTLLFIFCSLNIFIVTHAFIDSDYKKIVDFATLVVFVIEVLVMYGIIRDNIYCAILLAIATGILTCITALEAFSQMIPWTIVLIILAINGIAVSFIYDLYMMRKAENANKSQDTANPYQRFNQNV